MSQIGENISNTIGNIGTNISNAASSASQGISSATASASEGLSNIKSSVSTGLEQFSSNLEASTSGNADAGFLQSNGLIAKFAFLVLIVVAFILIMKAGIQLIGYFTSPDLNPYLIKGQISGDTAVVIKQNPALKTAIPIYRSNNQPTGIEFTWSVWLLYKLPTINPNSPSTQYQPIFVKGDATQPAEPFYSVNNGPGAYFGIDPSAVNTLYILMDTVSGPSTDLSSKTEQIIINNIPINKYFHLAVRCQNKYVDVYINGTIVYRTNLVNVPKQNFYDIRVCENGGFNGNLSNLRYFSRALSVVDINGIVMGGPNLTTYGSVTGGNVGYSYLSTSWYSNFLN